MRTAGFRRDDFDDARVDFSLCDVAADGKRSRGVGQADVFPHEKAFFAGKEFRGIAGEDFPGAFDADVPVPADAHDFVLQPGAAGFFFFFESRGFGAVAEDENFEGVAVHRRFAVKHDDAAGENERRAFVLAADEQRVGHDGERFVPVGKLEGDEHVVVHADEVFVPFAAPGPAFPADGKSVAVDAHFLGAFRLAPFRIEDAERAGHFRENFSLRSEREQAQVLQIPRRAANVLRLRSRGGLGGRRLEAPFQLAAVVVAEPGKLQVADFLDVHLMRTFSEQTRGNERGGEQACAGQKLVRNFLHHF